MAVFLDGEVTQEEVDATTAALLGAIGGLRIPIVEISIEAPTLTNVVRGQTYAFDCFIGDPSIYGADIAWSVSNETYAAVNEDGTVTILNKTGTVILTGTDTNTGLNNSIVLRVI